MMNSAGNISPISSPKRFQKLSISPKDSPDGFLPHVVFGDILNPIAVRLLKRDDYRENRQLRQLFDLYESFASSGDADTQDLLQTTLLEYLWDETVTYERAIELMGEKTREIWDNIRGYMKAP